MLGLHQKYNLQIAKYFHKEMATQREKRYNSIQQIRSSQSTTNLLITKFTIEDFCKQLIEDSVEFFCDEHMISGELSWLVTQCYATAKVEQFKGNIK